MSQPADDTTDTKTPRQGRSISWAAPSVTSLQSETCGQHTILNKHKVHKIYSTWCNLSRSQKKKRRICYKTSGFRGVSLLILVRYKVTGFGGLGVACWPQGAKILSTPSFGGEVKPSVPCRRFAACKRSLNLRGSRNIGKITTGHLSRPQFHLSLLGSLASLRTEAPGG